MKNYLIAITTVLLGGMLFVSVGDSPRALGHCQVPCGIYDDEARIAFLREDAITIKKCMTQINELAAKKDALSFNQASRWVQTKEDHASHIITVVSEYFLTQKVKDVAPGADNYRKYLESLATHHRVLRAAMKTKQTVDSANAEKLHAAIKELGELYD